MVRVFVSHSSKDNDLTDAVCALLRQPAAGGGGPLEVLVDTKTLEAGGEWPIQLHEMMADCHAAVVLLTKNAVASPWVLKETTILAWRRSLQPGFKLFVVQFPDVTEDEVKRAGYEPTQHRLVQGLPGTGAADIAARVHAAIDADAVQPAETLFERLVTSLAAHLAGLGDDGLQAVAGKLQVPAPPWRPGQGARRPLVEAVACAILRGRLGAYGSLEALMNHLQEHALPAPGLKMVLRFAAPHWVSAEAASLLGGLTTEEHGQIRCRPAAINGMRALDYTGAMYVQRAFPLDFVLRVCGPPPATAGNTVEHYTAKIVAFCRKEFPACQQMDDPGLVVTWLRQNKPCLFVVVSKVDHLALAALQADFPRVRFIVSAGPAFDDAALPTGLVRLRPPVDVTVEDAAYLDWGLSRNIAG